MRVLLQISPVYCPILSLFHCLSCKHSAVYVFREYERTPPRPHSAGLRTTLHQKSYRSVRTVFTYFHFYTPKKSYDFRLICMIQRKRITFICTTYYDYYQCLPMAPVQWNVATVCQKCQTMFCTNFSMQLSVERTIFSPGSEAQF